MLKRYCRALLATVVLLAASEAPRSSLFAENPSGEVSQAGATADSPHRYSDRYATSNSRSRASRAASKATDESPSRASTRRSYRVVSTPGNPREQQVVLLDPSEEIIPVPSDTFMPSDEIMSDDPLWGEEPVWSSEWCGECGTNRLCCGKKSIWRHRTGVWAEYLYLRPANVDVIYAVEKTGPDPVLDSPTGPTARLSIDHESGLRGGFSWKLSDCSSIVASYTWYDSGTDNGVFASTGNVWESTVSHPSTNNAAATSVRAVGAYSIDFQLADLAYRHAFYHTDLSVLNYSVGVRFATLDQIFRAQETDGVGTGLMAVATDIDFDGAGLSFGLDAERHHPCNGLFVYGKSGASFLTGEYKATFRETNQFGASAVVANDLIDYRLITILEAELGVGWQSRCGNWRWTAGWLVSAWTNTLTTTQYISGVQATEFDQLGETLAFSGLSSRLEWRY